MIQEIKTQSKWLRCGTQCVCCDLAESYLINKIDRIEAKLDKLLAKKETKPKTKKEDCPMTLDQFIDWCNKSPQRRIRLIGEWADTIKPDKATKLQWQSYLVANTPHATKLAVYTDEQIEKAFSLIQKDLKNGCDYMPGMATLLKKLTK